MGGGASKNRKTATVIAATLTIAGNGKKQNEGESNKETGQSAGTSAGASSAADMSPAQQAKPNIDIAEFPCLYSQASSKWPIRCYGKFDFNINAYHGGCTSLLLVSCAYGGKDGECCDELLLLRSGFDGNHVQMKSVATCHKGHFGCSNSPAVDEDGNFIGDFLFGTNHAQLLSNDARYGTLDVGASLKGPADGSEVYILPPKVNESAVCLILCSGREAGVDAPVSYSAIYIIMISFAADLVLQKLVVGDDKWKFVADKSGQLAVTGVSHSHYGIIHNRKDLMERKDKICTALSHATDGGHLTTLLERLEDYCTLLVFCSNSNGFENDSTVSALYCITVDSQKLKEVKEVSGCHGKSYNTSDLWKFQVQSGRLIATGPDGPCRYGLLSNMKAVGNEIPNSCSQKGCLATGEPHRVQGSINVDQTQVTGTVDRRSQILLKWNHKDIEVLKEEALSQSPTGWTFSRAWTTEEKLVGYHLVRVFAIRKHITSGENRYIELSGSPYHLTIQKQGVVFAVNSGGPAYQSVSDITYASEHKLFANFSKDYCFGAQSKAFGGRKTEANLPHLLLNTFDGFLHTSCRSPFVEAEDEKKVNYKVPGIPNGKYKLRMHANNNSPRDLKCNGTDISQVFKQAVKPFKFGGEGKNVSYVADVNISVSNGQLEVDTKSLMICGFALLDKDHKEKVTTKAEQQKETEEKQQLANTVAPITNSISRKEMEIVGWSPNLLQNASGEANNLSHWNVHGNWKVHEGGYGTEKAFASSHMQCVKYQEVNLLDYFSEEYLDTSPDIQVSEWYREGVGGGGFYSMEARLMDYDGNTIKSFSTGNIGSIYKNNNWFNAATTFTDYGPNVRIVSISSSGKDDKFWAGHWGPIVSSSEIRVKSEKKPGEGDKYCDIVDTDMDTQKKLAQRVTQERLISQILSENKEIMQNQDDMDNQSIDSEKFQKLNQGPVKKRKTVQKKREIRVFVSSTFRDFTDEREEIIKKAFREINRVCADRGIFFTYVDLRWGITTEQTEDGKTIAICLQEIDRCRPYFLCLMGERFGWSQRTGTHDETLNASFDFAIENYPQLEWIKNFRFDSSVTQLEILHGVLNDLASSHGRSFFYMREPPDKESLTEAQYKARSSESEWHHERQTSLKQEIRKHPELKVAEFKKAEEVANLIKKDLEWCIDQDFPKGTELTKLQQERESHEAFRDARCQVYIGREEYFTQINEYRKTGKHEPLVLLGESGSGKSALVANWTNRTEVDEPDTFLFFHFIGSSADSADYMKLLRRLYEEIKDYFNLDLALPSSDAQVVQELSKWLTLAGSRAKCVLVFDALNQLDDGSGQDGNEHDLLWIPRVLPDNVFLLLSTLPGRAMAACKAFNWPNFKVEPLDISMKEKIVTDYLEGIYGKTLNQEQKKLIIDAPQTNNPLYLRSLLDEVRMYGKFRTLTDKIRDYLNADSPGELFAKILERLEEDFEIGVQARKNLVCEATTAIWCSHRGMSESELVEILQVPSAVWSPFYLSLAENLVNRNGILNFFHDHLRQAVETKYLSTPELKKQGYLKLASYFDERPKDSRTVDELPFLLTRSGELDRLKQTVTDLDIFCKLYETEDGQFELIKAWKALGGFSQVEESYKAEISKLSMDKDQQESEHHCKLLNYLADFFLQLGLLPAARKIYQSLMQVLERKFMVSHGTVIYDAFGQSWKYGCKHPDVIKNLDNLGRVYTKLQEFPKAVEIYKESINRQNRVITPSQKLQLSDSLIGLASVYVMMDKMVDAKKLFVRSLELATNVLGTRHHYVAAISTKLGQLSYKQSRLDEALGFFLQDLKVTRGEVGTSHPRTATVLNEIALVYDDKNNSLAGQLYETSLSILLDTFGQNYVGTAIVRYNLGAFYFGTNFFAKAQYQFEKAQQIFQTFLGDDHPDTKAAQEALETVMGVTRK